MVDFDGTWCLSYVAVGTAEEIVGTEALVGGAVMVEVVDGLTQQAVGGDGDVVAVQAVGLVESGQHGGPTPVAVTGGDGEQPPEDDGCSIQDVMAQ